MFPGARVTDERFPGVTILNRKFWRDYDFGEPMVCTGLLVCTTAASFTSPPGGDKFDGLLPASNAMSRFLLEKITRENSGCSK